MSDEDILRKALETGVVTVGGKEFPLKVGPSKPDRDMDQFNSEMMGTFSDPRYDDLDPKRVRFPEFPIESNPTVKIDSFLPSVGSPRDNRERAKERPEVMLREGIRAALRGGLSHEKIKEIFELELVSHVMES